MNKGSCQVRALVLGLSLLLLAGVGVGANPVSVVGVVDADWRTMDPGHSYEPYGQFILDVVYDRLVGMSIRDGSIYPRLATEWTVSEDGLTYTFRLRDDVKFSTGNPLDAHDVVFSFTRLKNMKGNPSFLADNIATVSASDDYTVVITLHAPEGAFLTKLSEPTFGVLDSAVVRAQGGTDAPDAAQSDKATDWLNENSAGSGPYVVKNWVIKDEMIIERNPNYWGEAPQVDRFIFKEVEDPNTQALQLRAGDVDLAFALTADQIPLVQGQRGVKLIDGAGFYIVFLLMNEDVAIGGPMADEQVRQAVRAAIDYDGLAQLFGAGSITPHSFIQVGFAGALPSGRTRDVARAKQLMAEAGYADGFDVELEVATLIVSGVDLVTAAQKVQQDLSEIGIRVTLKPAEVGISLPRYRDGLQPFSLWYWGPDYPDPATQLSFLPGELVGLRANWTADDDPELYAMGRAALESNPDDRVELLEEIQRRTHDYGPWAIMLQMGRVVGARANVDAEFHPRYGVNLLSVVKE